MTEPRPPADRGRGASRPDRPRGDDPYARPLPPRSGRVPGAERRPDPPRWSAPAGDRPVRRPAGDVAGPTPGRTTGRGVGDRDGWDEGAARRDGSEPGRAAGVAARRASAARGLRSWQALLVLIGVAALGAVVDAVIGGGRQTAFAIALVVGSLAAILLVRRTGMFPVVVAPPLVYVVGSAIVLYSRSGGLSDRKVLIDAATSWLVYGFPAIAGATALVLIVAGIRLALRR